MTLAQYTPTLTPARLRDLALDTTFVVSEACRRLTDSWRAADGTRDRVTLAARHTAALGAHAASVQQCGCEHQFDRIVDQLATAISHDRVADGHVFGAVTAIEGALAALRAINGGLERAARALRGGAR